MVSQPSRRNTASALRCLTLAAVWISALTTAPAAANWVWWEGERPKTTNFPPARPETDKGKDVLSEATWIGANADWTETPFLEYEVAVPDDGEYELYVRKFWKHGPFRWRFDDQPWQQVGRDVSLLDNEEIRLHWGANWIYAGAAKLAKGTRTLRLEGTNPKAGPIYIDCFCLASGVFIPRGKIKPDQPWPEAPQGWFNFNQYDTLFAPSPIDLRGLNEPEAGANGFIGVEGENFVSGGKPIRFLAVCAGPDVVGMPHRIIDRQAKFLARKGVNLVRYHGPVCVTSGPKAGAVDEQRLDDIFYYIAAMKREGIYTHLSIYFQHWFHPEETGKFPGYKKGDMPFAIHFYNEEWQKMYREWWRALLTRPNPYTGKALKDDPAVMGLELLNEDSFFFWTFDYKRIPEPQMAILEKMFGDWLTKKYGSIDKALGQWKSPHERDNAAAGRAGFEPLWQLFNRRNQRDKDTARFLAEVQRKFFDDHDRFVKKELGFKGVVCASNWRTANTAVLGALDKWTNAGCDFMDHHGYYGAWSEKKAQSFNMAPGDLFADRSLSRWDSGPGEARRRLELPFICSTIAGKPAMVSEYAWQGFNDCRAEMPLIVGALASQSGMDAMVCFALESTPAWQTTIDGHWPVLTPAEIGQFPGKALLYRQRMVSEAKPVASVRVNVEEMMNLKGNAFTDPASEDANRGNEGRDTSKAGIDARCFAHGPVTTDFVETGESSFTAPDPAVFHNADRQELQGASGQIDWQYGKGLFLVKAPQAQAVCGFLGKAGEIALGDVTVKAGMPFGAVWAVAMDGRPLASSRKILVQVMSEQRNAGFETKGEPKKQIVSLGGPPLIVRQMSGEIQFSRSDATELAVTALDINGCPKGSAGAADRLVLQPDTIYYLIEKR